MADILPGRMHCVNFTSWWWPPSGEDGMAVDREGALPYPRGELVCIRVVFLNVYDVSYGREEK